MQNFSIWTGDDQGAGRRRFGAVSLFGDFGCSGWRGGHGAGAGFEPEDGGGGVAAGGGHAKEGFPYEKIGFDSGGAHSWAVVGFEFGYVETETKSDDVGRDADAGHADRATAIALEEIHSRKKK